MHWIVVFLALFLWTAEPAAAEASRCADCHTSAVLGAHEELACLSCHEPKACDLPEGEARRQALESCLQCHPDTGGILHGPMATRRAEKDFVERSWGKAHPEFFDVNCADCHVSDCLDCHGLDGHSVERPRKEDCHSCHRGYYVGADYYGMAPREDALRYQRGLSYGGEHYLKMRPDVHSEAGLQCGDCHSMGSLAAGKKAAKTCTDCHTPSPEVVEHGIAAHLEKLECYACHSAWAPQEYGTFFIRLRESTVGEYFRVRDQAGEGYVRSAYLKRQDLPPLAANRKGKVSPVRPQFIAYYTEILKDAPVGEENRLMAVEWKTFFPHTVRRGAPMCDSCHDNPSRYLLEEKADRIYLPAKDGMRLESFWTQEGQRVSNGNFVEPDHYRRISDRSPEYIKAYVEKWKNLVNRVEDSSRP